ncbi:MAG: sporulation-like protein [Gammaproteobacteria bacterium]|nr:sporulation-like protein [Gammaproteobacteria bacterium]
MPRDYKNSKRKPAKKPIPGWVWLLTGLMIGLLIALLVYLSQQSSMSSSSKNNAKVVKKQTKKVATKKTSGKKETRTGLRYEFYTVLPKSEIVITDQEIIKRERESRKGKVQYKYLLQAGSFRKKREAESLKARMALLGIESDVQKVEVNGDDWYRVRIGPLSSNRELNGIRNRLVKNNISAILIRVK